MKATPKTQQSTRTKASQPAAKGRSRTKPVELPPPNKAEIIPNY